MSSGSQGGQKRPAEKPSEPAQQQQEHSNLATLAGQIEAFEAAGEQGKALEAEPQPQAKRPQLGVHSLTQNTTHRRIRCG